MSDLLVHSSKPDPQGRVISVTPESAQWHYVGFDVYHLNTGQELSERAEGNELCLVILSGKAEISVNQKSFGVLGERENVFQGLPWSIYVPCQSNFQVNALTALEIAVCKAPAKQRLEPRIIAPHDIAQETRGQGTNIRYVRNILPDTSP